MKSNVPPNFFSVLENTNHLNTSLDCFFLFKQSLYGNNKPRTFEVKSWVNSIKAQLHRQTLSNYRERNKIRHKNGVKVYGPVSNSKGNWIWRKEMMKDYLVPF